MNALLARTSACESLSTLPSLRSFDAPRHLLPVARDSRRNSSAWGSKQACCSCPRFSGTASFTWVATTPARIVHSPEFGFPLLGSDLYVSMTS
eukprot:760727-Hanusia_phi.AAC.6